MKILSKFKFTPKRILLLIIILLILIAIIGIEIYSPIYINKFEDLDVKSEVDRIGGDYYKKDGYEIYYADYKNLESKDTIILLHGLDGSSFSWRKNLSGLTAKYHVISFDLLGFGFSKTNSIKDIGLDKSADIINKFIDENKLNNVTIVGNSIGGIVAQKLAILNPNKIIGLVLINSLDSNSFDNKNQILQNYGNINIIKNPLILLDYNSISKEVHDSYFDQSLIDKLTVEGYQKGFRYKGSSDQLINFIKSPKPKFDDLNQIKQLTLIYSSQEDKIVDKNIQDNLNKKIPNSTIIKLPKVGHLLMEEQPLLVNEGISKWIEEIHNKINMS